LKCKLQTKTEKLKIAPLIPLFVGILAFVGLREELEYKLKSSIARYIKGDIKKLANFYPGYRLRVGHWRVLFEVTNGKIIVYRIIHRKEAYR